MKQIFNISQPTLVGKFRLNLQLQHRFSEAHNLAPEFCYGWSWTYLRAKSKGEQEAKKFFQNLYIVAAWDGKNKNEQVIVDNLYKEVDRIQNSEKYDKNIKHSNVTELFNNEVQNERRYYFIYNSPEEIHDFLKDKIPEEKQIICGSASHATAIFQRDNTIFYYDSNNSKGERSTNDLVPLSKHIYHRLKTHNKNYWNGSLPFTYAVFKNSDQQDSQLISYEEFIREQLKLDPNCLDRKDGKGVTALYLAAQWQDKEACSLLLSLGADPNVYNAREEMSLYERLILKKDFDIALLLAANDKFDIHHKTKEGKTPLQLALEHNCAEIVAVLLKKTPPSKQVEKACFEQLTAKKTLSNLDMAFALMDKYAESELAVATLDYLTMPKSMMPKLAWTSMFQRSPQQNDEIFAQMLKTKIDALTDDINSPQVLHDVLLSTIAEFESKKMHWSDELGSRINFINKYLQHSIQLEKSAESTLNINLNQSS